MGFADLVMLMLKSFDLLAWPLISLVYPIWASIRAIESNSNGDNRKWLTFWTLVALAMLFENIFEPLIKWIPFWLEMKLVFTFSLAAPRLNGAIYVYENFIRPCFLLYPQTCRCWFNNTRKTFLPDVSDSENFLFVVDRYIKENGSEVLEKLIAEKVTFTESNLSQLKGRKILSEEENKVTTATCNELPCSPVLEKTQEEWACALCQVSTSREAIFKCHLQSKKHRKQEDLEALNITATSKDNSDPNEKEEPAVRPRMIPCPALQVKSIQPYLPWAERTENISTEKKKVPASKPDDSPGSPVLVKIQKECTGCLCQLNTSSEGDLKYHFLGKNHKENQDELRTEYMATRNKGSSDPNEADENKVMTAKFKLPTSLVLDLTQKEWTCALCQVSTLSEGTFIDHLQGKKHKKQVVLQSQKTESKNKDSSDADETDKPVVGPMTTNCMEGDCAKTTSNAVIAIENKDAAQTVMVKSRQPYFPLIERKEIVYAEENTVTETKPNESLGSPLLVKSQKDSTCCLQSNISADKILKDHFLGKNNKEKQEKLIAENIAAKIKYSSEPNEADANQVTATKRNEPLGSLFLEKNQKEWTCIPCQVNTLSEATFKGHLQGKKHRKQADLQAHKMPDSSDPSETDEPVVGPKTANFMKPNCAKTVNSAEIVIENKEVAATVMVPYLPQAERREIILSDKKEVTATKLNESPGAPALKKTQNGVNICQLKTYREENLKDHFLSKNHKEKQEELGAKSMAARNNGRSDTNEADKNEVTATKHDEPPGSPDLEKPQKEWISAPCQVNTLSEATFKDHLQGKKVRAHKMATKYKDSSDPNETAEAVLGPKTVKCTESNCAKTLGNSMIAMKNKKAAATVQVKCTQVYRPRVYNQTLAAEKNKISVSEGNEPPRSPVLLNTQMEWTCALCQVSTSSDANLKDHLGGKKHLEKEAELKASKMAAKRKAGPVWIQNKHINPQ
ncbi:hypothetical protein GIB67_026001 [Kingdonia uniflora]|uniref:HVA22-like protein n=1 Tax=Kingdonia uniflora TaxID=39325 RepID=A0A7J7M2N7_9MAGN|nr:hypothetical protein GIB67_026001 [Kingdonia uniflora]